MSNSTPHPEMAENPPAPHGNDALARAEQAFERGDYLTCRRLVASFTREHEQVNSDQAPVEAAGAAARARDLEARLASGRASWIVGAMGAVVLAGICIRYLIPW